MIFGDPCHHVKLCASILSLLRFTATDTIAILRMKNLRILGMAIPLAFIPFLCIFALGSLNIYYYEMFTVEVVFLLFAGFFWVAYSKTRQKTILVVSIIFSLYALYEFQVNWGAKYGDAMIRIDLLLFFPALYLTSVIGVWSILKWYSEKHH